MMSMRLLLLVSIVLSTSLFARKATVSLSSMQQRSEIIVIAEALQNIVVFKPDQPMHFHLKEVLKGNMNSDEILVYVTSLGFEKGEAYILFLHYKKGGLSWIKGNSIRLKATPLNMKKIKKVIDEAK